MVEAIKSYKERMREARAQASAQRKAERRNGSAGSNYDAKYTGSPCRWSKLAFRPRARESYRPIAGRS